MDIQKTMEFILEQQAAASAQLLKADVVMSRLIESHYNLEQNFARLAEAMTETQEAVAETNRSVSRIALASAQTDARLDRLTERVDVISSKVDALVDFVASQARRPDQPGA